MLVPGAGQVNRGRSQARVALVKEIQSSCRRVGVWTSQGSALNVLLTYSAPAERASAAEIAADHQKLLEQAQFQQLLDNLPEPAMILNRQRQVVLASHKLAALLKVTPDELLGSRPGEILNCVHSSEGSGGCGTSRFCAQCGVARTIFEAQATGTTRVRECRIACPREEGVAPLDLQVWATPLAASDRFTVFAVRERSSSDRSAEERDCCRGPQPANPHSNPA